VIGISSMRAKRILYVQYTNPAAYPPIEHSAHLLADAGVDVRLLGTGILGDAIDLKPHPRIDVRLWRFRRAGWGQKIHYLGFIGWAAWQALRWQPDWIYASDPLSCPIALVLRRVCRARLIYHEHDSPEPGDGRASPSGVAALTASARRSFARRADVCVLPNQQRADLLSRAAGRDDVLTVWNCPMRADVAPERGDPPAGRLKLVYHGSIVPSRLPRQVIEALAHLPHGVTLQICGYETAGHPGYVRSLLDLAGTLGLGDRVTFAGTVRLREDLMRLCATGDVGLALLPPTSADLNERTMLGATNKPFDYLASGLPVLVANLPDWRATFVDSGFGLSCDAASIEDIAAAVRWFLEHPAARLAMGREGRQRIRDQWNYETTFAPVLSGILSGSAARSPVAAMTRAGV
jgi:glycosyltransferase involved in cell wall biosynthesis